MLPLHVTSREEKNRVRIEGKKMEYRYLKDINNILHTVNHLKMELQKRNINVKELIEYEILVSNLTTLVKELQEDQVSNQHELDNISYMVKMVKE